MNNTLGLKARPNWSATVAFQPGQANEADGLSKMMAAPKSKTVNLNLSIVDEQDY